MTKQWHELTETQQAQVKAIFDQRLSDAPERYTYTIGSSGSVISRKHI